MRVDAGGYTKTVVAAGDAAAAAEERGYDAWWAVETQHDAFLGCAVASQRTSSVGLGTGIAVAFARNPMNVAVMANDLQIASEGRFMVGLGSQIKPHITKRFSMEWSHPAPRMREFVLAMRAIWEAWATGGKLDFRGDFYTHTLMTPFFDPGENPFGTPPVYLAAVGPLMTETAGEVADGMICHGFSTERYVREKTLPALRKGAEKAGKTLEGFELVAPSFVVAADTEEEQAKGVATVKSQIGFYGSTPAYRPVLELHGWGDLQDELNALTKRGEWGALSDAITDEVVDAFAVVGTPEEAFEELDRRYGDICTRVTIQLADDFDPDRRRELFDRLRTGTGSGSPAA